MLYVSRTSLSGDLHGVESTLNQFGLTLERRPRYGLKVEGSEMARRLCLASVAIEKLERGHAEPADHSEFAVFDSSDEKCRGTLELVGACVA